MNGSGEPPTVTTRRQVLAAAAALAVEGCLEAGRPAGTSTDEPTSRPGATRTTGPTDSTAATTTRQRTTAAASLPPGLVRQNGEILVDATALADGDLSTRRDGGLTRFEYTSPVATSYELAAVADGELVEPGPDAPVLATPALTPADGTPRAFVVPAYRTDGDGESGAEGFTYEVFVNAAFAALDGLHVVAGTGGAFDGDGTVGGHTAAFEPVVPGILRERIDAGAVPAAEPGAPLSVLVADASPRAIRDRTASATGVALLERDGSTGGPEAQAPEVAFAFDERDGTLTVGHEGGDAVDADRLTVLLDGEPAGRQFAGTVRAGDRIELDLSGTAPGLVVSVVWSPVASDEAVPLATYRLE